MGRNDTRTPERPIGPLEADEFAALLRRSYRSLWLIAVGITRDGALAEDVVQDAAMIALGKLSAFVPDTNFTAWLGQIVRNVALNRARKERRSRTVACDPETVNLLSCDAHRHAAPRQDSQDRDREAAVGAMDAAEIDRRIRVAFEGLSEAARSCLLLRTVEGWSYARIAEVLSIPEGTAMSHVHRSRKLLRTILTASGDRSFDEGDLPT